MTLQNGLTTGNRVLLWSDTALFDPHTGKLLGYDTKAFQLLTFPAVVTMTTIGANPHLIAEMVGKRNPAGLGDLLATCEDTLREFVQMQPAISTARLLVGGWCYETDSARLLAIASDGGTWGLPYVAVEVGHYVSSGNESAAYQMALGAGIRPEHMLAIAEAQRAEPFAPATGGFTPFLSIGGSLVEHEVTRQGVTSRVVREWGEPVEAA